MAQISIMRVEFLDKRKVNVYADETCFLMLNHEIFYSKTLDRKDLLKIEEIKEDAGVAK